LRLLPTAMKTIQLSLIILLFSNLLFSQSFQDKPSNEANGNFPANWDIVKGTAEIATLNGEKVIALGNQAIIKPLLDTKDYLSKAFTLEFDAYFDSSEKGLIYQYYQVRFWEGANVGVEESSSGTNKLFPLKFYRHGADLQQRIPDAPSSYKQYIPELESIEPLWRHIKIDFKDDNLKFFINEIQVLNIPRLTFPLKIISIEGYANRFGTDRNRAIKNIKLTNGSGGQQAGTKIILIVNNETNQVQNIELYETMKDPVLVNKKYPNSIFTKACFMEVID